MWYCCNACVLTYADDAETPFSSRSDFQQADGGWRWTLNLTEPHGFWVRLRGGAVIGWRLRLKLVTENYESDVFVFSARPGEANELSFVYLGEEPIPIAAFRYTGTAEPTEIHLGIGWRYPGKNLAALIVRYFDADGGIIAATSVPLPLVVANTPSWQLVSVSFSGASRVTIVKAGGPDAACCPPIETTMCQRVDVDLSATNLSYLPHFSVVRPEKETIDDVTYSLLSLHVKVSQRTSAGSGAFFLVDIGDCCQEAIRVELSPPMRALLVFAMCRHGGPQLLASLSLPGLAYWNDTPEERRYDFEMCLVQGHYLFDQRLYFNTRIGVRASAESNLLGSVSGVISGLGSLVYNATCAIDAGGLAPHIDTGVLLQIGTAGPLQDVVVDTCGCEATHIAGDATPSHCFNNICLSGYYPPGEQPSLPDEWRYVITQRPGLFSLLPEQFPITRIDESCFGTTTTETTSAEGNQNPIDQTLAAIIRQIIEERYGLTELDLCHELFCVRERLQNDVLVVSVWGRVYVPAQWELNQFVPVGEVPLFLDTHWTVVFPAGSNTCRITQRIIWKAVSPFPNCQNEIAFTVAETGAVVRECYDRWLNSAMCEECENYEFPNLDNLQLKIIPVRSPSA